MQEEQGVHKARTTPREREPLSVEEMVYQDRASYVNKQWRIVGLVSAKGRGLNGLTGTVVDYDTGTWQARLHWQLEDGGKIVKLKPRNLQALGEVYDRKEITREMSAKEIAAELVARERASFVDKPWRIVNLISCRGRQLNNRECWVRGFDTDCEARLHCEVQGEVGLVKLRAVNLEALGGNGEDQMKKEVEGFKETKQVMDNLDSEKKGESKPGREVVPKTEMYVSSKPEKKVVPKPEKKVQPKRDPKVVKKQLPQPDTKVAKNLLPTPNLKLPKEPLPTTYSHPVKNSLMKPNPLPDAKPLSKSDTKLRGQPTTRAASKPVLQHGAPPVPVLNTEPPKRIADTMGLKKVGTNRHPSKYKTSTPPPSPSAPPQETGRWLRRREGEDWKSVEKSGDTVVEHVAPRPAPAPMDKSPTALVKATDLGYKFVHSSPTPDPRFPANQQLWFGPVPAEIFPDHGAAYCAIR